MSCLFFNLIFVVYSMKSAESATFYQITDSGPACPDPQKKENKIRSGFELKKMNRCLKKPDPYLIFFSDFFLGSGSNP